MQHMVGAKTQGEDVGEPAASMMEVQEQRQSSGHQMETVMNQGEELPLQRRPAALHVHAGLHMHARQTACALGA